MMTWLDVKRRGAPVENKHVTAAEAVAGIDMPAVDQNTSRVAWLMFGDTMPAEGR